MSRMTHKYFSLKCPQCNAAGTAEWWDPDGRLSMYGPKPGHAFSSNFKMAPKHPLMPDIVDMNFDGALVCTQCDVDAVCEEVGFHDFHKIQAAAKTIVAPLTYTITAIRKVLEQSTFTVAAGSTAVALTEADEWVQNKTLQWHQVEIASYEIIKIEKNPDNPTAPEKRRRSGVMPTNDA